MATAIVECHIKRELIGYYHQLTFCSNQWCRESSRLRSADCIRDLVDWMDSWYSLYSMNPDRFGLLLGTGFAHCGWCSSSFQIRLPSFHSMERTLRSCCTVLKWQQFCISTVNEKSVAVSGLFTHLVCSWNPERSFLSAKYIGRVLSICNSFMNIYLVWSGILNVPFAVWPEKITKCL